MCAGLRYWPNLATYVQNSILTMRKVRACHWDTEAVFNVKETVFWASEFLATDNHAYRLQASRVTLGMPLPDQLVIESVNAFMLRVAQIDIGSCTHCACEQLQVIGVIAPHLCRCIAMRRARHKAARPTKATGMPALVVSGCLHAPCNSS